MDLAGLRVEFVIDHKPPLRLPFVPFVVHHLRLVALFVLAPEPVGGRVFLYSVESTTWEPGRRSDRPRKSPPPSTHTLPEVWRRGDDLRGGLFFLVTKKCKYRLRGHV